MTREEAIKLLDPETTAEAIEEIEYYGGFSGKLAVAQAVIDACVLAVEALKAKPVVHAHWEEQNDGTHFCSRCGNDATYTYEGKELVGFLCPFCGAQMDEKENENED